MRRSPVIKAAEEDGTKFRPEFMILQSERDLGTKWIHGSVQGETSGLSFNFWTNIQ